MGAAFLRFRVAVRAVYLIGLAVFTSEERPEFEGVEICPDPRERAGAVLSTNNGSQVVVVHDDGGFVQGPAQIWKIHRDEIVRLVSEASAAVEEVLRLEDLFVVLSVDNNNMGYMQVVCDENMHRGEAVIAGIDNGSIAPRESDSDRIRNAPLVNFPKFTYLKSWQASLELFTETADQTVPSWIDSEALRRSSEFADLFEDSRKMLSIQGTTSEGCIRILIKGHPEIAIFSFGSETRRESKIPLPQWVIKCM